VTCSYKSYLTSERWSIAYSHQKDRQYFVHLCALRLFKFWKLTCTGGHFNYRRLSCKEQDFTFLSMLVVSRPNDPCIVSGNAIVNGRIVHLAYDTKVMFAGKWLGVSPLSKPKGYPFTASSARFFGIGEQFVQWKNSKTTRMLIIDEGIQNS
jgi:hypothetical protein